MVKKCAMAILQWSLGSVVLIEGAIFGFTNEAAHAFHHLGLPHWVRPAVAGAEMLAAARFLIPATSITGGWILFAVLVSATSDPPAAWALCSGLISRVCRRGAGGDGSPRRGKI